MEIYKDIFTKEECDYIIKLIKESYQLTDFLIYDPETKGKTVLSEYSQRKGINFYDEKLAFVEERFINLANRTESDVIYNKVRVYRFNEYNVNEYINYHGDYDAMHNEGAIITIGLFLNDDYTGGDFCYKEDNQEHKVEQKTGTVIIFKSDVDHMITPVTSGVRYSINAWPGYKIKQTKLV